MNPQPTSPRDLDFPKEVLREFDFLLGMGYEVTEVVPASVSFKCPNLSVKVWWYPYAYEVDVDLKAMGSDQGFSLGEALSCMGVDGQYMAWFSAASVDVFLRCLTRLATALREGAAPFIQGDEAVVANLVQMVNAQRSEASEWSRHHRAKVDGDSAWDAKDYARCAGLYESALPILTPSRRLRLAYIRRRELG